MAETIDRSQEPAFFTTPADLRAWLEQHNDSAPELWVGFYKKGSGMPSITWPESVDEALCFGWIDGLRKGIDDVSYKIRFTPRNARSIWSAVNIKRVAELTELGRMQSAGLDAFAKRTEAKSAIYSHEQANVALAAEDQQQFRDNKIAWDFFQAQPAGYRRAAIWWVLSAKRAETRRKRLATLIADSAHRRTIAHLTRSQ